MAVQPDNTVASPVSPGGSPESKEETMDYFDIMMLGQTGQGKTSTTNKLLIANPTGKDYQALYPDPGQTPTIDPENRQAKMQDLLMWMIPTDADSMERTITRIKNLSFFRCLDNPSLEVNGSHKSDLDGSTQKCELFSNETTKVRILDVPGFLSAVETPDDNITGEARNALLSTVRNILHTQAIMALKFKRVLYFLPGRDVLQRTNAALQEELKILTSYFGREIFESMVLVATLASVTYELFPNGVQMPENVMQKSRTTFQETLKAFISDNTPNPPIIFVSLTETCESILQKVKATKVSREDLQLQLQESVCARCNVIRIGDSNGKKVAYTRRDELVKYEESKCHPKLVPLYTGLEKAVLYLAEKAARRNPKWADFSVEKCLGCSGPAGTPGCMQVGDTFQQKGKGRVTVDHTNKVETVIQGDEDSVSETSLQKDEGARWDNESGGENTGTVDGISLRAVAHTEEIDIVVGQETDSQN